jgi:hypothetical protein
MPLLLRARLIGGRSTYPGAELVAEARTLHPTKVGFKFKGRWTPAISIPWSAVEKIEVKDLSPISTLVDLASELNGGGRRHRQQSALAVTSSDERKYLFLIDRLSSAELQAKLAHLAANMRDGRARSLARSSSPAPEFRLVATSPMGVGSWPSLLSCAPREC